MSDKPIRIAIIDLYDNEPNQGMRCIREIISQRNAEFRSNWFAYEVFETRYKGVVPGDEFDIYISSGGPGSPFDGQGKVWEKRYFGLLDKIWSHNQRHADNRRFVFFICHSFQMMARYFELATVRQRCRKSFGIVPVLKTEAGQDDPLLKDLPQVYYAADFRQFEVVEPRADRFAELGAGILSHEKLRKDAELEHAMMAIRISPEIVGTQFHPEADPESMLYHFRQPERKEQVIAEHGVEKYDEMLAHLKDPQNILLTRRTVLPGFLNSAAQVLRPETFSTIPGDFSANGGAASSRETAANTALRRPRRKKLTD